MQPSSIHSRPSIQSRSVWWHLHTIFIFVFVSSSFYLLLRLVASSYYFHLRFCGIFVLFASSFSGIFILFSSSFLWHLRFICFFVLVRSSLSEIQLMRLCVCVCDTACVLFWVAGNNGT